MLTPDDWQAVWLTIKLASLVTLTLIVIGTPIAWWLAQSKMRFKVVIEAIIALPLILPPTVLGFYLLVMISPNSTVGAFLMDMGLPRLAFTFEGLVIASVIYSLPFVVQPLQAAFQLIPKVVLEAATTLRSGVVDQFFTVILPLAKKGFLNAAVLGFAHTIGEFGVVLMIGGNLPGETKVLSIAIYEHVEVLDYTNAHILSAWLLLFSFIALLLLYSSHQRLEYKLLK